MTGRISSRAIVGLMVIVLSGGAGQAFAGKRPACVKAAAETRSTEAVVRAYVQTVFIDHRLREGLERYVAADVRQHNPNIADGRAAALAFLEPRAGAWTSQIVNIVAEGHIAVVQQHAFSGPDDHLGRALVDIYRVEHGLIVEHWDVSQAVPEHALNTMF